MPSRYAKSQNVWPLTTDPLFAEDAVPEYIALDSRYAYVVFQVLAYINIRHDPLRKHRCISCSIIYITSMLFES